MRSLIRSLFRDRSRQARKRHYSANKRFAHLKEQDIQLGEAARKHLAVFVHIPKAGGTTIKNLMVANYGRRYRDFHPRLKDVRKKPDQLADLNAVSAHRPYGYHLTLREILRQVGGEDSWSDREPFVFSITRDPVDRLVSSYNFITTFPAHALYPVVNRMEPDEFFAFLKTTRPEEFYNLQCQFIAGTVHGASYEDAKASLGKNFVKVVDLESQSRLIEFLIERLGWNPTGEEAMRFNESPKKLRRTDLGSKLFQLIEDANQEDLRLADHVRSLD